MVTIEAQTKTAVYGYYSGCELKGRASGLDLAAKRACQVLGITLTDMPDATCCGGLVPQVKDDYKGFLAPARILLDAHRQGYDELVTLCAFCFNTLRRSALFLQSHPETRARVATFLEVDDLPEVRVVHLLEVLRDQVGFDRLRKAVQRPLKGLRVAPYYGCLLLRPAAEMRVDDPNNPTLMEGLLEVLGCEPVDFSAKSECCGSYHIVTDQDLAGARSGHVLRSAVETRVDVLVTTCPVCQFNLDWRQRIDRPGHVSLPIVYFPQLLALALGEAADSLKLPEPALTALSRASELSETA